MARLHAPLTLLALLPWACATPTPPVKAPAGSNGVPTVKVEIDNKTGALEKRLQLEEDPATGEMVVAGTDGQDFKVLGNEACELKADCTVTNWMGCCPPDPCEQFHPVHAAKHEQRTAECDPAACPKVAAKSCEKLNGVYVSDCFDGVCGMLVSDQGIGGDPIM